MLHVSKGKKKEEEGNLVGKMGLDPSPENLPDRVWPNM
jgi:hypothetical protein